jgi:aminopeptidase N
MTREAELKARDFVALVVRGVHAETEVGVAQRLLLQAQTALAPTPTRLGRRERLAGFADALLELARELEPGRTISWRTSTRCAIGAVAPSRRRAVDAARQRPARPCLAASRSTPICAGASSTALAAAGVDRRRRPEHAVHRRRGRTRSDRRRRAACRAGAAARPQAAVKERPWQQVVEDDTLANVTARSMHRRVRAARPA